MALGRWHGIITMYAKGIDMPTGKKNEDIPSGSKSHVPAREVYERPGSSEHNDYRIAGSDERDFSGKTDDKDRNEDKEQEPGQ